MTERLWGAEKALGAEHLWTKWFYVQEENSNKATQRGEKVVRGHEYSTMKDE